MHFLPNLLVSLSSSPYILLCSFETWVLKSSLNLLQFYVQAQSNCSTPKSPITEFMPFETANSKTFQPKKFNSNCFWPKQVLDLLYSFSRASYCYEFSKIAQYQQAQPITYFKLGLRDFIHTHALYFLKSIVVKSYERNPSKCIHEESYPKTNATHLFIKKGISRIIHPSCNSLAIRCSQKINIERMTYLHVLNYFPSPFIKYKKAVLF